MDNRGYGENFRTLPSAQCGAGGYPFAAFKFGIGINSRLLLWTRANEKEPCIETPSAERRRNPASDESEVSGIKM
jgi:hypothetical protein